MNKEFVLKEEALALEELGFEFSKDEICFGYYNQIPFSSEHYFDLRIGGNAIDYIEAPLYQQAFRWFREKYGLDSYTKHLYKSTVKVGYFFCIDETDGIEYHSMEGDLDSGYFKEYEEADLARLRKLIELVKTY